MPARRTTSQTAGRFRTATVVVAAGLIAAGSGVPASAAAAVPGDVEALTVAPDGALPDVSAYDQPSVSASGRFVAFTAIGKGLLSADNCAGKYSEEYTCQDIFVRD